MRTNYLVVLFVAAVGCGNDIVASPPDMVMPTCQDNIMNGDETDTDCGGSTCLECPEDQRCNTYSDCGSGVCTNGTCTADCFDGVRNGDEIDTDCGGKCGLCGEGMHCPPCPIGQSEQCNGGCSNTLCTEVLVGDPQYYCINRSYCRNGAMNQDETDVDCGGPNCPKCLFDKQCNQNSDCLSDLCTNGRCVATAICTNKVRDAIETDTDCGGACKPCSVGQICRKDSDCEKSNGRSLCDRYKHCLK